MIFEETAAPMVESIFDGYNTTIFAYGQTGSGKTHTMMGESSPKSEAGIIPRFVDAIFERIDQADVDQEFTVKLAYVEIYNEKIKDLLNPDLDNLRIREGNSGVWIEDVTEQYVGDVEGVLDVMAQGTANRAIATTNVNEASSRSHSVFILTLGQRNRKNGQKKGAKLFLVDLAGSEKVRKTGASGQTMTEAQHINRSLSALGNVINKLCTGSKQHIPYRDSKLTRLLSDALGGNSKTCLVVTCTPSGYNVEETVSTLRFGTRAKAIKNKVFQNVERSAEEYRQLFEAQNKKMRIHAQIIRAFDSDLRNVLQIADPTQIVPDLIGPKLLNKFSAYLEPLQDERVSDENSELSETGSGRRSVPRSPRMGRRSVDLSASTPDRERKRLSVPQPSPSSLAPPGLQSQGQGYAWSAGDQLLIINESEGEDTEEDEPNEKRREKPRGKRRYADESKETSSLRQRVLDLEETLALTSQENAEKIERTRAITSQQLNEKEHALLALRQQFSEQLAVSESETRKTVLEKQSLEAQLEEFALLRKRVELMESQHGTDLEVNESRRHELLLENEELAAHVDILQKDLAARDPGLGSTARGHLSGSSNRPENHHRSSSYGEGSEQYEKLSMQNHEMQQQLKLVESKLSQAHQVAHSAQQKSLARVAKLEKQLAQASVMCEKLLQSSMYWRDRRQAMTRAKIMIPIQGGGGHGRPNRGGEVPSSPTNNTSSASSSTTTMDSMDRFF